MEIKDVYPSREEVARFIEDQLNVLSDTAYEEKFWKVHYGVYELRHLIDFIFAGKPSCENEKINYGKKDRSS